jgi:MYXO-CTERM domain-containing protein
MRKQIAIVGLATLLSIGASVPAFAQQQTGSGSQGSSSQQPSQTQTQSRNDNEVPWGLLGLLGLGGLAGLKRQNHDERRVDRPSTSSTVGSSRTR